MIGERRNRANYLVDVCRDHVVMNVRLEVAEPPRRDLRQHRALVRDRLGHHDVECAHAIRGDEQQAVVVDDVHFAYFAAAEVLKREGLELRDGHTRTSSRAACRCPASNGSITSERNSSTCSGARPTNRVGSSADCMSANEMPKSLSADKRSSMSLRAAPFFIARAASMLCCRMRSFATWRSPPARTARTMSYSVAMNGNSSSRRRRMRAG